MKKILLVLTLLVLLITMVVCLLKYSPKGNDYIEWERNMVKANLIKPKDTQYFKFNKSSQNNFVYLFK